MAHPSLSFVYCMTEASSTNGSGLTVTLSTDSEAFNLRQINENTAGWTHGSTALAAWSGQSVTLTWSAPQPAMVELELSNNTQALTIFVGRQLLLPARFR
jgi:hypothetical protein